MDQMPDRSTCAAWADDIGTLAVGALTGRERAAALAHVERCSSCAAELESLSTGADALLALYPELDPGEGFTERVMALIEVEQQRPVRRRPPARVLVAMAAAVVALALVAGLVVTLVGRGQASQGVAATAVLHSPSGPEGKVVLTSAHGNWLIMMLDDGAASGTVTCQVTLSSGSTTTVGRFALHGGYGSWAVRLPVSPSAVVAVRVVGPDGEVVASARV